MDPDLFGMFNQFAPKPGQDPFALGAGLATNPDQYVNDLAKLGPPPAPGQGFPDYVASAAQNAGPQPPVGNPPPSVSGAPQIPPPIMPPRTPPGTGGATAGGTGMDMGALFPGPPQGWFGPPSTPSMGPSFNEAFGSVPPGTGATGAPGTTPPPVSGGLAATAPPPVQGAKPDILAANDERTQPAGAPKPPLSPEQAKKIQDALKSAGGLLAGVKAPPAPETQRISSPSLPRTGTINTGGIEALIQAMMGRGGAAAGAAPLRLGNALYAGGRGLY